MVLQTWGCWWVCWKFLRCGLRLWLMHQLDVTGSRFVRMVKLSVVWSTCLRRYSERIFKPARAAQLFVVLSVCLLFLVIRHVTPVSWYLSFCSQETICRGHLLLQNPSIHVILCFYSDFWLKNDIPILHSDSFLLLSGPDAKDIPVWRKAQAKSKKQPLGVTHSWVKLQQQVLPIKPSNDWEWIQFQSRTQISCCCHLHESSSWKHTWLL